MPRQDLQGTSTRAREEFTQRPPLFSHGHLFLVPLPSSATARSLPSSPLPSSARSRKPLRPREGSSWLPLVAA